MTMLIGIECDKWRHLGHSLDRDKNFGLLVPFLGVTRRPSFLRLSEAITIRIVYFSIADANGTFALRSLNSTTSSTSVYQSLYSHLISPKVLVEHKRMSVRTSSLALFSL
jgi:hypothetical protein